MAGLWQRTGTVTVTSGSKTITGFGTKWKTGVLPIQKGHAFYGPDNLAYEVDTVVSDTEITLVEAYRGGTLASQAYRIDITRTSTISQFSADLAALVGKYRSWFDSMITWLTGSGDVSILNPDTGATTSIPSWAKVASEGEGQAARAKTEADRSKTEADRAKANADLAGGIVAAAALPLPDVWLPLSDSLRMITGYGKDVLVGSDVVARLANCTRATTATYIGKDGTLKTAAINEPRFEKEGLLIEGQSTNLNIHSQQYNWGDGQGSEVGAQVANTDSQTLNLIPTVNQKTGGRRPFLSNTLTIGKTYTISFRAMSSGGAISQVANKLTGAVYPTVIANTWTTYSFTGVAISSTAEFTLTGTDVSIAWIQVEELPFASSYIPTSGSAVTRAQDQAYLPALGNRFITGVYALAVEFDLLGIIPGSTFSRLVDFDNSGGADRQHLSLTDTNLLQVVMGPTQSVASVAAGKLKGRAAFIMNNLSISALMDGVAGNPVTAAGIGSSVNNRITLLNTNISNASSFGHLRNLRMWSKNALTNEQLRAAV